jgi:hypothetical protein
MKISEFKKRFLKKGTKFILNGYGGALSPSIPFIVEEFSKSYSISRLGQVANISKITNKYIYFYSCDIFSNIITNKVPISSICFMEPTEDEIISEKLEKLKNLK